MTSTMEIIGYRLIFSVVAVEHCSVDFRHECLCSSKQYRLLFAWDEEPEEDIQNTVESLAENYFKNLDVIIDFMLSDIKEIYGEVTVEDVKEKLGKPVIDYNNGKVTYYEQSFDDCHIFEFEFMDDAFEDLQYFSIDG